MNTTRIREKLHHFIDSMEDKKAAAVYMLFADEIDTGQQRKKLILAEREKYLKGEGKSYAWDEVKQMALKKGKRYAI